MNYLFFFITSHFDYFTDWTEVLRNPWPLLWKVLIITMTSNTCKKKLPPTLLPSFLNTLYIKTSLPNTMSLLQFCEVHLCHPNKVFPGHFVSPWNTVCSICFGNANKSSRCHFKVWSVFLSTLICHHYCLIFSNK